MHREKLLAIEKNIKENSPQVNCFIEYKNFCTYGLIRDVSVSNFREFYRQWCHKFGYTFDMEIIH